LSAHFLPHYRPRGAGRVSAEASRCHQPRTPLARPGQGAASARTASSGLRVVHWGPRHARSEGCEGVAGRVVDV